VREQHLDRDLAVQTLVAREPHFSGAARAQPAGDRVGAQAVARAQAPSIRADRLGQSVDRRREQERAPLVVGLQQGQNLAPQRVVVGGANEEGRPRVGRLLPRFLEELVQSLWTVRTDTSSAWAVSSADSPPKKRISTTRAFRGSSAARRSSAPSTAARSASRSSMGTSTSSRDT
jgi:hypothetical protein